MARDSPSNTPCSFIQSLRRAAGQFHAWLMGGSGVSTRRQKSRRFLRRGMQHMLKDDFFEAVVDYNAAVGKDPTGIYAVVNRGLAWMNLKDFEMARADFETAMRLEPDNWYPYLARGRVHECLGDAQQAQRDYTRALALIDKAHLPKEYPQLMQDRGLCFLNLGEYSQAIDDAEECIRLKPDDATGYAIRGAARLRMDQFEAAVHDYSTAIRLGPPYANWFACRGSARNELGLHAEAIADLDQAIALQPGDIETQVFKGAFLVNAGQWELAKDQYEKVLALDASNALAMNNLAWLLSTCPMTEVRDGKRAVELANEACSRSEWKTACYIGTLAAARAEIGDFEQAVKLETTAISLYSEEERRRWAGLLKEFQAGRPHRLQNPTGASP